MKTNPKSAVKTGEFLAGTTYQGEAWVVVSEETKVINILCGGEHFRFTLTKPKKVDK